MNVHAIENRETKPSQARPSAPVGDLFRLDGRTVVITGANGFLGSTLTTAVLESGADVVCTDVLREPDSPDWPKNTALADTLGLRLIYLQCDQTDASAVSAVFGRLMTPQQQQQQLLRHPIRGLVACAGVSDNGPSVSFPADRLRRLLDINLTGTFLVCQAVAANLGRLSSSSHQSLSSSPPLSCSMVLVASMSGHVSNRGVDTAGYNASKAGVHQLARSLAAEWGSRRRGGEEEANDSPLIRVNTLSPGYIRTAATAESLGKAGMEEQWTGDNMLLRLSEADEYRAPVVYMLGDGSSFMTGADLRVDGGHCAW